MRRLFTESELRKIDGPMTLDHVNGSHCGENTYVSIGGRPFARLHAPTNSGDSDSPYTVTPERAGDFAPFTSLSLKRGIVRALVAGGRMKRKGLVLA